jgi:Carboxypeptidase regulatory-like domain/TonB dependent receptor
MYFASETFAGALARQAQTGHSALEDFFGKGDRMRNRSFIVILLMLLVVGVSMGQESRGTVMGRVTDAQNAVIPSASVQVVSSAMGTKLSLTTNDVGFYQASYLIPGMYQITVEAPGFKKSLRDGIEVRVGDRLEVNITLEVGAAAESVTVTGEAPLLTTATASMGAVVDSRRLASLPLSYGDPFLLIGLTPGVTFNGDPRLDRPFEPTHIVNFSMGGTRGNLNDVTIDGAPSTATANANEVIASYVPPTDIVQEFRVQTATFDAQFGQTQGGVTNISIKSGTNLFHGTAGYSFQRPSMWANDFFNNKAGLAVPDFRFDRWTGSIGGPIRIPKVYDGRNKTFFLFGYEGIHDARPRHNDATNTIPTPAMHTGDFSQLLTNGGATYQIYDPNTRVKEGSRFREQPFSGNMVPPKRITAVGAAIMSYYPTTELTPGDPLGLSNYKDPSLAERATYWNLTARVDQNLGDKQRFFVRYSMYARDSIYNDYFHNDFYGNTFAFYSKQAMFDHVYTLSPTMVLNTRYSYNRFIRYTDFPGQTSGFDLSKLAFSSQFISQVPKEMARFPRINYASTSYISNGLTCENRPVMNHTVSATLSKAANAHSIRGGFEYRVYQETDSFKSNQQSGQFTFGSTWTRGPLDNSTTSPSGYGQSIAALLLGLPDSANIVRQSDYVEQSGSWGFFVQDDWKASPKLTVNLGVRYEFETPMKERYNKSALSFDTTYVQPISAAAAAAYATKYPTYTGGFPELPASAFALRGGMTFPTPGGNGSALYNTPKNIVMPRVGLAYQIGGKTVVRAGFGMFAGFLGERRGDVFQNGFTQNTVMTLTRDTGLTWATTIANPFPDGITEPVGAAAGYQTYLGQGFTFFNQNPKVPITLRWQLGLQHEFKGFVLETSYVGSKTNHLESYTGDRGTLGTNINAMSNQYMSTKVLRDDTWNNYLTANISNPMTGLLPGNTQGTYTSANITRQTLLSPYRAFGSNAIYTTDNIGFAWYHGLLTNLQKRFSKGYTINFSYTYSKWMQAVSRLNAADPLPIREISESDAPHRFNISGVWELPFGKGKPMLADANPVLSRIVGGWQISGGWTLQSGFPLPFGNNIYYGDPGNILLPIGQRTPDHWFNITGFETASTKQLTGTQLRWWPYRFAQIRGPRGNECGLAVIKDTRIAEGKNLQFRAEALNAFNHPIFPNPLMTVTTAQSVKDTGFGQISASNQANYARRLQFTIKYVF